MIKNVRFKRILKNGISPFFSFLNRVIPKDDDLVFLYSANKGCVFSNFVLRDYLLQNNYDAKYKIVCGIESLKYKDDYERVSFVSGLKSLWTFLQAGHVFYTAGQLPIKPAKTQCVIHMRHGNEDFKSMGANTNINNGDEFFFTYMILSSDLNIKVNARAYKCKEENIVGLGDPMCDKLLTVPQNVYDFSKYKKVLLWVPTFRQSDYLNYNDSHLDTLIPLFADDDYENLNEMLAKYNILLIVKLHPAQSAPNGCQRHFSHLRVYSHDEFIKTEYDMYTLMAHADGLIGDYSSASLQYLLLDRPEAYVVPDLEDYKNTRGFVYDDPEAYMGGHIVKTKKQFEQFIDDFANERDIYKDKRHWVCNQIFKYKDAKSCERIVKLSGMSL